MFGWPVTRELEALRAQLAAAENLRADAHVRLGQSETARQREHDAFEARITDLTARLNALDAERKTLLDRIVQMSGQPPLFTAPAPVTVAGAPPPDTSSIPGPRARANFDDVHEFARQAIRNKTLNGAGKVH